MNIGKSVLEKVDDSYYRQTNEPLDIINYYEIDNMWSPMVIKDIEDEGFYLINNGFILNSVGKQMLKEITGNYMDLLYTSTIIFEKNGNCALRVISSEWCRHLYQASKEMLPCYNSCWRGAAELSIQTGEPVDSECYGGLHIYTVPIRIGKGEIAGAICVSYGDPPKDIRKLRLLSNVYGINTESLLRLSHSYKSNSPQLIKMARERIHTSARLIGVLLERKLQANLSHQETKRLKSILIEQKKIETALRSSQERLSKAFNSNPALMAMTSINGSQYIDVNDTWLQTMGFCRGEVIGHNALKLNTWKDPQIRTEIINTLIEKGSLRNQEIQLRTKWNTYRTGLLSGEVITLNGEKYLLKLVNDITEIKDRKKGITSLERLSLIAQMAAGVAHEIRNPLTTIYGFLQLFLTKSEFSSCRPYLELMLNELDRVNSIISEFLSLSKNKPENQDILSLNNIVNNLLPILETHALHSNKFIKTHLSDIPDILLNENEIKQLILNLVKNGLEAMSQGGTVTIRTYREDKNVIISIQDEGQGINSDILDKIGSPFLTTKHKGRGLGLAICFSIARRHNAIIDLQTDNKGSLFNIRFPAARYV